MKKVGENMPTRPRVIGYFVDSYRQSRSEKLAEVVLENYFQGQINEEQYLEIDHSDSARNNCGGLDCRPISGKVIGKPYLSASRKTLLVNLQLSENTRTSLGLLTLDRTGWKSTGWELVNKEEGYIQDGEI